MLAVAERFVGKLQAGPEDVDCAPMAAANETVPAAAARGVAEDPV